MRREETGGGSLGGEVRVEAEYDIGLGALAFKLEPVEQCHAVGDADPFDLAIADRLEGGFDFGTGAPFRDEAFIGVDGELRRREAGRGREYQSDQGEKKSLHGILLCTG